MLRRPGDPACLVVDPGFEPEAVIEWIKTHALVPAAILALRHGSKVRKIAIPFAPFLAFGAVVALFFGDTILDWYLGIFG